MASRLLDRLKRSLFKEGQGAEPQQEQQDLDRWEAELEEEESVAERLGGTLCFDGGLDDGAEGGDSDSDTPGEPMEEGLSSTGGFSLRRPRFSSDVYIQIPVQWAPPPSSLLARQLQDSWRSLRGAGGSGGLVPAGRRPPDSLMFEVTDATVVMDGSSKYVLYTIHVIQSGGSDKTPAVISRRYSDFQKLHAALRRHHGDQMERVSFPREHSGVRFASRVACSFLTEVLRVC
ncbi:sorting nexin-21 [Menidia menidia]